jgi:DNA-directed RNA polymerase specialized sigma24 family protein
MIEPGDVMQITYLEAFLQISTFRLEQAGSFEAWLRRIAENNLRDAVRGLERQKQMPPSKRIEQRDSSDSFVGLYEQIAATTTTPVAWPYETTSSACSRPRSTACRRITLRRCGFTTWKASPSRMFRRR